MNGGFKAWTNAGYTVTTNIVYPGGSFTKITGPLTLASDETGGTFIPYGAVIIHWANGITEVTGADNRRILLAKDAEAATVTTSTGEVKPVTWIYQLPQGATVAPASGEPGITRMMLDGNVILTIIQKLENFTE